MKLGCESAVALVDQYRQQGSRVIGLAAPAGILLNQAGHIQFLNHLNDKAGEVSFREPVLRRRGQEVARLAVGIDKVGRISFITLNYQ